MPDGQDSSKFSIPVPPDLDSLDWADAGLAQKEEKNWSDYEKIKTKNDLMWLRVYGFLIVFLTIIFTTIFIISLGIWSVHYMAPDSWLWLSEAQLSRIQSVLFSGGMGAIVSSVFKRQLDKLNS